MSPSGRAAFAPRNWFYVLEPGIHQGRPKEPKPVQYPVGHGPFKCRYCGRYGQPGACAGCGAPNAPAPQALPPRRPDTLLRMHLVEAGVMTPNEARRLEGLPRIPEFPMVKR